MGNQKQISDRILRQAVKRRDALKQDLHEMELFIKTFERLAASKEAEEEEEEDMPEEPKPVGRSGIDASVFFQPVTPVIKKIKSSPKRDVERVVREVLERRGEPTPTAEMLKLVNERGITIGGREPRWNLAAKLSRMEDVENIKGLGWRLKGHPLKMQNYILTPESEGPDA